MKKIVFITTRPIFPISGGREVVLFNYCKGLYEYYNCEINLISFGGDEKINNENKPYFINEQHAIEQPSILEKLNNLIKKSLFLKEWPMQVSLYYSKKNQIKIKKIINDISPDILIFDMARTAEYIKGLEDINCKKILDMDDLLSKRYYRQVTNMKSNSNILGQYSKNVPNVINKFLSSNKIKNKVLVLESNLLSNYEIEIHEYFDDIVFVSPKECEEFDNIINTKKSLCATIGVDYEFYSKRICKKKKEFLIGFLGNMYIPHNQDAVKYFLENIFDDIKKNNPLCKFRIIGKCSPEYIDKFKDSKYIELTGEVDDIRLYMQECSVMVAPLQYGTGIKTKILETMAMGVPVITNEIGVEGISIKNGYDISVCSTKEEFIEKINLLLNDKSVNEKIIKNAINTIKENYVWEKTLIPMKKILN